MPIHSINKDRTDIAAEIHQKGGLVSLSFHLLPANFPACSGKNFVCDKHLKSLKRTVESPYRAGN